MIGAIIGDVIGSFYEGKIKKAKSKNFELFTPYSICTDDTIMTIAVGQALVNTYQEKEILIIQKELIKEMQKFGQIYPYSRYGKQFSHWLREENPKPYNSFGNGSGMRVSSVAWLYDNLEDVNKYAEITASVSHNHPEGIKGACAVASAIYLASHKKSKDEIKKYIEEKFEYILKPISQIVEEESNYGASSQITVPVAIQAFLEGKDFEDVLRTALFAGGDTDTIACMACSIAEVYYKIPDNLVEFAYSRMDLPLKKPLKSFLTLLKEKNKLNDNLKKVLILLENEKI
ncbi:MULTISPECIES: ADP-ribosylglycohydrolase family protein [Fusobacterium]|uniref:ADP-ribosylglycohydrolase family protein n=1 Tax=Fusobacterium canifelinum TaxID=285729 RepID=A0ABX7CI64_9FUSO|nr:ADP-ribosylglycohydrolase family protein [Fusobacterium canifelinum]QQS88382.1 ADP-ribosylglycohydrolase family protein [Fusobacterium canifelinum]